MRTRTLLLGLISAALLVALAGCGDDDGGQSSREQDGGVDPRDGDGGGAGQGGGGRPDAGERDAGERDAGEPALDAGEPLDAGDQDAGPPDFGGLLPTTAWLEHEIDLLGTPGHRFWIEVDAQQLARMNSGGNFPGPVVDRLVQRGADAEELFDAFGSDIYVPGNPVTFADHVVVQDATSLDVADYGQLEVKLVGESTARQWDFAHIPNVKIDSDEFEMDKRIGGFEHIRLNNGLVGSIFREVVAHRIYRALDYPALRASWAFLGSNVWGPDIWVPMTLIEVYKRKFCDDNAEQLGGTCENMWEFAGDLGGEFGGVIGADACQVSYCDDTRLHDLADQIAVTDPGPGFKQALSSIVHWERFHQFQCLSWILGTGDDPIHNSNNNLIIERDDGMLIWAPYSVDISAGQDWYPHVPLVGNNAIARGCQSDPACWADTLTTCEDLIARFDALDPELIVDDAVETVTDLGMMRDGDESRAETLRQWYVDRQVELGAELELYRHLPDASGNCEDGYGLCGTDSSPVPAEECLYRGCVCLPEGECGEGGGGSEDDGGVVLPPPIWE